MKNNLATTKFILPVPGAGAEGELAVHPAGGAAQPPRLPEQAPTVRQDRGIKFGLTKCNAKFNTN